MEQADLGASRTGASNARSGAQSEHGALHRTLTWKDAFW